MERLQIQNMGLPRLRIAFISRIIVDRRKFELAGNELLVAILNDSSKHGIQTV